MIDFQVPSHLGGRFTNISHVRMRSCQTVCYGDPCDGVWSGVPDAIRHPTFTPRQTFLALQSIYESQHQDIIAFDIYDAMELECCDHCPIAADCSTRPRVDGDIDCITVQDWAYSLFRTN